MNNPKKAKPQIKKLEFFNKKEKDENFFLKTSKSSKPNHFK